MTEKTNTLGEELRRLRGRATIDELSTRLGTSKNTLGGYERGDRSPDVDFLISFADETGADLSHLLECRVLDSPNAPISRAVVEYLAETTTIGEEFVRIPFYDVGLGAGFGRFIDSERVSTHLAFRRDWLRDMGLEIPFLALASVRGPSMSPALEPNDTVLLDLRRISIDDDDIYAIRLDGQLLIKRMQRLPDGKVRVISDNPAYDSFTVELSRFDGGENAVVGLYVWHGHVNRSSYR